MLQILNLQQLSTSVKLKAGVSVNEWALETFLGHLSIGFFRRYGVNT